MVRDARTPEVDVFAFRRALRAAIAAGIACLLTGAVSAIGPESTVLVVNRASAESATIAHVWQRLRGIPASHVVHLDDVPTSGVIPIAEFRSRIWTPLHAWLEAEGLLATTDLVVYSVGFPYGVDFTADVTKAGMTLAPPISPTASLTAVTFLASFVVAEDPRHYLALDSNPYFRRPTIGDRVAPAPMSAAERELEATARAAARAGNHAAAIDAYRQLLATRTDHAGSHYDLACSLALVGQPDAALAELEQAVACGFVDAAHAAADPDLTSLRDRAAFRAALDKMRDVAITWPATVGFHDRTRWAADATQRFWLSAMLGYVGPNGSTVAAVESYLTTAAAADGTNPAGTVYLLANDDVRANTREPLFASTSAALQRLGRSVAILTNGVDGEDGVLPKARTDVLGLVAGIAGFDWNASGSRFVPGALAEHLTSFGAHFGTGSQTKCTRFLDAGAAGTCGAVAEPYAVQAKFPVPYLHVHYAQGVTMVEAMYLSLAGPYQTLVLGDPLARPFAHLAQVAIDAPSPKKACAGTVSVTASVRPAEGHDVADVELWVDGRLVDTAPVGEPFAWDTTTVDDGVHELRVVAVEFSPIGTRSGATSAVTVRNGSLDVRVTPPKAATSPGDVIQLGGSGRGVTEVEIRCGATVVARGPCRGGRWKIAVPAAGLGVGAVTLVARGVATDGRAVRSAPFEVRIAEPAPPAEPKKRHAP